MKPIYLKIVVVAFLAVSAMACTSKTDEEETDNSFTQNQTGSFVFDGNSRKYMVFLPKNYPVDSNFPLVIYLHSYGWSASKGMNYTNLNQVADSANFIVAYPSAMPNWNSGISNNSNWPTPNVDDVGFINELIDTLINKYSIDSERIYACGYSNGGFMSYKLACQLSHRIAAIASVCGLMSTGTLADCAPGRPIPVLQIHGTTDPWVNINGSMGWLSVNNTLNSWIDNNNCSRADTTMLPDLDEGDGCRVERICHTDCANNCEIIYYKITNGGHTWPGAGPPGFAAGNTNQDINASVEIWGFFKKWTLSQ